MPSSRTLLLLTVLAGLTVLPATARAQSFGIGPRFSFVRGALSTGEPATRFFGGTMRLASGKHTVWEGAMDYRTYTGLTTAIRLRETPIQGSLLLFLSRGRFAPYALGGFGIYNRMYDQLDAKGNVILTARERKTGLHLGFGAEIRLSRHAALFGDYRLRFVKFGTPDAGSEPVTVPGFDKLKLSHQGSMWTSGMAFYF